VPVKEFRKSVRPIIWRRYCQRQVFWDTVYISVSDTSVW